MSARRIHHFTATLSPRDAVGAHTLAVDDLLREMGHDVTLFAASVAPELKGRACDYRDQPAAPAPDLLIYQTSTGSPVADLLLERSEPLILNYHNLTPAEHFDPWEPHIGAELDAGRRQLARLCRRARAGIAVSGYNAGELVDLGLEDVRVAPVVFDPPKPTPRSEQAGRSETILFVGRLAPNKAQHDLIAAVALLRTRRPDVRLVLIGTASSGHYEASLRRLASEMCPGGVDFLGSLPYDELVAWYGRADVFLCLSDHEGFCVPVLEAMSAGQPVVAFAAAAVPETVGDAAVVIEDKRPTAVVAALERVLDDIDLRTHLAAVGRQRAAEFAPVASLARNREVFAAVLEATR